MDQRERHYEYLVRIIPCQSLEAFRDTLEEVLHAVSDLNLANHAKLTPSLIHHMPSERFGLCGSLDGNFFIFFCSVSLLRNH